MIFTDEKNILKVWVKKNQVFTRQLVSLLYLQIKQMNI